MEFGDAKVKAIGAMASPSTPQGRAEQLLLSYLGPQQQETYLAHHFFYAQGCNGSIYAIVAYLGRYSEASLYEVRSDGPRRGRPWRLHSLRVVGEGRDHPIADRVLALLLWVEGIGSHRWCSQETNFAHLPALDSGVHFEAFLAQPRQRPVVLLPPPPRCWPDNGGLFGF